MGCLAFSPSFSFAGIFSVYLCGKLQKEGDFFLLLTCLLAIAATAFINDTAPKYAGRTYEGMIVASVSQKMVFLV